MKFKKELNPILETIGLCCYIKYKDDICEETVEALNRLGVDGQLFYDHNYPLINQYADDFATKYEPHIDEEVLFGSMDLDMDTTYIVMASIVENPHWIDQVDQISEEQILRTFSETVSYTHLDVYKRQIILHRFCRFLLLLSFRVDFLERGSQ